LDGICVSFSFKGHSLELPIEILLQRQDILLKLLNLRALGVHLVLDILPLLLKLVDSVLQVNHAVCMLGLLLFSLLNLHPHLVDFLGHLMDEVVLLGELVLHVLCLVVVVLVQLRVEILSAL
jgi:hypothetical protein